MYLCLHSHPYLNLYLYLNLSPSVCGPFCFSINRISGVVTGVLCSCLCSTDCHLLVACLQFAVCSSHLQTNWPPCWPTVLTLLLGLRLKSKITKHKSQITNHWQTFQSQNGFVEVAVSLFICLHLATLVCKFYGQTTEWYFVIFPAVEYLYFLAIILFLCVQSNQNHILCWNCLCNLWKNMGKVVYDGTLKRIGIYYQLLWCTWMLQ